LIQTRPVQGLAAPWLRKRKRAPVNLAQGLLSAPYELAIRRARACSRRLDIRPQ
jgi:hypothetical protein